MTALLEIGEDDATIANAAASTALRAFDGAASAAFFTGHSVDSWLLVRRRLAVI